MADATEYQNLFCLKHGENKRKYPLLKNNVMGSAYGEKMVNIYSEAKIVLNIHNPSVPSGGNMRLFEIPATKSFQIADKCPKDWFINGDEIVLFKDKNAKGSFIIFL